MSEILTPSNGKKGLANLVGKQSSKKVKFMDEDILIFKLKASEVLAIQEMAKAMQSKVIKNEDGSEAELAEDENSGLEVLMTVIRYGAEGASDLSDDDIKSLPLEELSNLSSAIMKFSGIDAGK